MEADGSVFDGGGKWKTGIIEVTQKRRERNQVV